MPNGRNVADWREPADVGLVREDVNHVRSKVKTKKNGTLHHRRESRRMGLFVLFIKL